MVDGTTRPGIPTRTTAGRFPPGSHGQRKEAEKPRPVDLPRASGGRALLSAHLDSPLGHLERDFIEIDKIRAGEFGSVMKMRYKYARKNGDRVFALKKSKTSEGMRHR